MGLHHSPKRWSDKKMRLSKYKRNVRAISFILIALVMIETTPLTLLGELVLKAFAGPATTMSTKVNYEPGNSAQVQGDYFFSKASSVYGKVNVTVPSGQMIKQITQTTITGEKRNVTPAAAIGQNHYEGTLDVLNGVSVPITSKNNNTAQGYYAWYRYIPGGGTGLNWYADLTGANGSSFNVNCGPSPGKSGSIHKGTNPPMENIRI
jgi:hypothetical protein